MFEQLSLDLGDQPPTGGAGRTRSWRPAWFFAIMPDEAFAAQLSALGGALVTRARSPAKLRPPELLHITLLKASMDGRSVGEGIAVAQQIGGAITDPPFEVISSKAMSFGAGRKRPLVLGCSDGAAAALTGLRDRLCDHAEAAGFHVGGSSFTPHMTLAYGGKAIPDTVLDEPVCWPARELVLVCSLQGLSKYIVMGRWAFRSRPN